MRELATQLAGWHTEGVEYALATVVDILGSAPLPLGASMAVDAAGAVRGSLSGGCVEGAVYDLCLAAGTTQSDVVRTAMRAFMSANSHLLPAAEQEVLPLREAS